MKKLLVALLSVSMVLGLAQTTFAQSGATGNDGDTPVHHVFLPITTRDSEDTLIQITSSDQLRTVLESNGFSQAEVERIIALYQSAHRNRLDNNAATPQGYSFRGLACFGTGAFALFDVGQGFFTANYLIPYPSGISGYCNDSLCTYSHSRGPAPAGIYGHTVSSDGFASHIYAYCS